jgi:thiol-disulfide isomerase/thioredoxin
VKARLFFIMTLLLPGVNVKAADAKQAAPENHGASGQEVKKGSNAPVDNAAAKASGPPPPSDQYVHRWIPFPPFQAMSLASQTSEQIVAKAGRVSVVVFLASWCVPCQQQVREIKRIEDKYRDRFTDFVYIFAHDTENDARGFKSVYKLGNNAMMASASVLEAFHQPELPSYYVADRYKWMVLRRINTQKKDLDELDQFLSLHTAL